MDQPWKSANDIDMALRHGARMLGIGSEAENEFVRRREEVEYQKEIAQMDDICAELLKIHK